MLEYSGAFVPIAPTTEMAHHNADQSVLGSVPGSMFIGCSTDEAWLHGTVAVADPGGFLRFLETSQSAN